MVSLARKQISTKVIERLSEILNSFLRTLPKFEYRRSNMSLFTIHFYKWLASVTLVVDKKDRYINYIAQHDPRRKK
jgi:hypothetical protein